MKTFAFLVTWMCLLFHVQAQMQITDCGTGQTGGIDLVFVLDESGSIGPENFNLLRQFAMNISLGLDIGLQRSLVGAILFDSSPSLQFGVTQNTNQADLQAAIANLPYRGGGTNTAAGLDLLLTAGQPGGALNLRDGFIHIAIVVTDGRSDDSRLTMEAASALHASNIYNQVFAIGVSGADEMELRAIASDPSLVFFTSNFDSNTIATLQQNVSQMLMPCIEAITLVTGDPHFMVPLLSDDSLCYSIQGYPGLIFNLIYNEDFAINALFIDSINDKKEATWIGKLAIIPRHANKSEAVIFDSVKQEVQLVDRGDFKAFVIDTISYDEGGKISVKFTPGIAKQPGNPTVHVKYDKPLASFDITFYSNHLDVSWDLKYDSIAKIHGLMGQFMVKGMAIDPIRKMLTYPDGHDPVAVEMDEGMTGKKCWKAMNPGHQGEGLIKGSVLDYMVSNLLEVDFKLKDF